MQKKVDNLIVGGGLAGVWLAFRFLKMGKSFTMVDKPGISTSTSVAAGIYNPVLPGRQKKSYQADLIYPRLESIYAEMEAGINKKVLFTPKICYILDDLKALNDWSVLANTDAFRDYITIRDTPLSKSISSEYGYLEVSHSGRVDIQVMAEAFKHHIAHQDSLIIDEFDEQQLAFTDEGIIYGDTLYRHVIFCQGAAMNHNRMTSHYPLKPAKGEILLIKTNDNIEDVIPQNGVFMLPIGNGIYKVGSNFEWDDLGYEPTEKAKDEILRKFRRWYKGDFEIVGQEVGLRPSSEDRRPILGRINKDHPVYVFNGLGSKGVALAPHFSQMLASHIYDKTSIDKDVDIARLKIKS